MKTLLSLFAFCLSLIFGTAAERSVSQSVPPEFAKLYAQWDEALVKGDLAMLGMLYAKEVVAVDADGVMTGKEEFLQLVKAGEYSVTNPVTSELVVRIYGKTAVVTSIWKAIETVKGKTNAVHFRCSDTWVKRSGRWEIVATHCTTIQSPK